MTLSVLMMAAREKGESFITLRVKVEVQMTGRDPCEILSVWLDEAKQQGNTSLVQGLKQAEKFFGCRNRQKRLGG